MSPIGNVLICLMAPLIIAAFCAERRRRRSLIFLMTGMVCSLLSSYICGFLTGILHADQLTATLEITPVIEEIMKLCPVLFYLTVFEPKRKNAAGAMLMTSVGFATFENVCYLITNGASHTLHLLIRGFGAGAMHVVCGAAMGAGMLMFWDRLSLRVAGTVALLCVAITYHAVYNVLVSHAGLSAVIGYLIPVLTILIVGGLGRQRLTELLRE